MVKLLPASSRYRPGDWVEICSQEEIAATLDADGRLDGIPFMPEMLAFCGQRFQVLKRAHKTCDTVATGKGRRIDHAVHLPTRCDGRAHGGCEADCLIFWKDQWLKPTSAAGAVTGVSAPISSVRLTRVHAPMVGENGVSARYRCQATELPKFSRPLHWADPRQYIEDLASGNVEPGRMLRGLIFATFYAISRRRIGLGRPLRWLYDRIVPLFGGTLYPRKVGTIPAGSKTPTGSLGLAPGELVRVKSHEEILETLDSASRNRGLYFDAEMVPFCGGTYRVRRSVTRIVDEKTGDMMVMKSPCIILEEVTCQARFSDCRMFCPRAIYPYWREIWLERVHPA